MFVSEKVCFFVPILLWLREVTERGSLMVIFHWASIVYALDASSWHNIIDTSGDRTWSFNININICDIIRMYIQYILWRALLADRFNEWFREDKEQLNYMIKNGPEASLQGVFLDLSKSYSSKNQDKLHQCVQFVVIYIRPENLWNAMGCQKPPVFTPLGGHVWRVWCFHSFRIRVPIQQNPTNTGQPRTPPWQWQPRSIRPQTDS